MTGNIRSVDEIERDIEDDRNRLTETLETLQDRFSVESVVSQVRDQFRGPGIDLANSVGQTLRQNPVACALVGAGVAWAFLGGRGSSDQSESAHSFRDNRPTRGQADQHYPDWVASTYASDFDDGDRDGGDTRDLKDRLTDKAGNLAERAKETAANLRDTLADGTEGMPEAARDRVVAARKSAIKAQRVAREKLRAQTETARDFHDQQPLVSAAIAMAIGAAIGGALPRTGMEDNAMGAQSDGLFDEAERVFAEERAKLRRVAAATADEAKAVIRETRDDLNSGAPDGETAAAAVKQQAKSAASRVADAAKDAAAKENLGSPKG